MYRATTLQQTQATCYTRPDMESIAQDAKKLFGIELPESAAASFLHFSELLQKGNAKTNLTAIKDPEEIATKHFLDSLSVLPHLPVGTKKIIDIGAGAGFPSIPLAIARTDIEFILLDAIEKKVTFLSESARALGLTNVKTLHGRAEDVGRREELRASFDVALARAVARLPILCEYALPLLRVGGILIAMKGTTEDPADAQNALATLGGVIKETHSISLHHATERVLLIIEKVSPTPDTYPRRAGMPEKRPL